MRSILFTFILLFLLSCSHHSETNDNFKLTIIHMNDIHSHLESQPYHFTLHYDDNTTPQQVTMQLGGMPRAVTKIHTLQKLYPNNLTLNAGDLIQGTLYFTIFDGNASVAMYNEIVWDGFEVGNHEWDEGDLMLNRLLNSLNSGVILAANIQPDGITMKKDRFKPYFIKEIAGERVGVVGIDIVNKTLSSSDPSEHITFLPELPTAQKYIDILLSQGVDKIVLLSHIGYANDLNYAQKLHGVDVIIGGDSHTLMGDYTPLGLQTEVTTYPKQTYNADHQKVCIAQAWSDARVVGELHILFDEDGNVLTCKGVATLGVGDDFVVNGKKVDTQTYKKITTFIQKHKTIEVIPQDTHALATLQKYKNIIATKQKKVIAYAKTYLSNNRIPYQNYDHHGALAHGSELAPIVCKGFLEADPHAQLCIQNAGGVRTPMEEGNITIQTAYNILPFKNTLYELTMNAQEIKQALEDGVSHYLDAGDSSGSFPYAYALRYDINTSQPRNHRITHLEYMDKKTLAWSPLQADQNYSVITHSYLASGHDGYATFAQIPQERKVNTYIDYAMSFVKYLKKQTQEGNEIEKLPYDLVPIQCYIDANHTQCPLP